MFHFLRRTVLPLVLLLMLLTVASFAFSKLHAPHPVSSQLAWCGERLICWLGIDTAQTTLEDAREQLAAAGYQQSTDNPTYYRLQAASTDCTVRLMPVIDRPAQIGAIGVQCAELRVAEVMNTLGAPDRVGFTCDGNYIFYYGYNFILNLGATLSPNQPVALMAISNALREPYQPRWFGFALPWRYQSRLC